MEAAEFLKSMPNKHRNTLKEILKKMRDRFKDSRTQSDFLYMLTTRRHNPKTETIREYSHSLHNLVVRAYPQMPDDQRMQILKQKFPVDTRSYPGSRSNNRYPKDRQNYRPRTYPEDKECHYCGEPGHLQYRCPKRLEDRQNGIERPIIQKNAKKICTNCGRINHMIQECRRPRDYKQGTAYDGIPYQRVSRNPNPSDGQYHESPKTPTTR